MKKFTFLLLLCVWQLLGQGTPQLATTQSFTSATTGTVIPNDPTLSGGPSGAVGFRMVYYIQPGSGTVSALSVELDGAATSGGSYTALTPAVGGGSGSGSTLNPVTTFPRGQNNLCCDFWPFLKIKVNTLTVSTGAPVLIVKIFGFAGTSAAAGGSGGGGGLTCLTGDVDAATGTCTTATVEGLLGVPFCSGYSPANGDTILYTTSSVPNPCYTSLILPTVPTIASTTNALVGDGAGNAIAAAGTPTNCVQVNGSSTSCGGGGGGTGNAASVVTYSPGASATLTCPSSTAGTVTIFDPSGTALAANMALSYASCTTGQVVMVRIIQAASGGPYTVSGLPSGSPQISTYPSAVTIYTLQASGATTMNFVNVAANGGASSLGSGAQGISRTATAGSSGVTVNLLADKDTSNPTVYNTAAIGSCGLGIAAYSATSGNTFELYSVPGTVLTAVADGTITAGHLLTAGASTAGRVADTGQTAQTSVPIGTCLVGVALASQTVGNTLLVAYSGSGIYGAQVVVLALATTPVLTANLKTCTATTGIPWRASVTDAVAPALGVALTGGGTVFANVHCSLTTGTYIVDGI